MIVIAQSARKAFEVLQFAITNHDFYIANFSLSYKAFYYWCLQKMKTHVYDISVECRATACFYTKCVQQRRSSLHACPFRELKSRSRAKLIYTPGIANVHKENIWSCLQSLEKYSWEIKWLGMNVELAGWTFRICRRNHGTNSRKLICHKIKR